MGSPCFVTVTLSPGRRESATRLNRCWKARDETVVGFFMSDNYQTFWRKSISLPVKSKREAKQAIDESSRANMLTKAAQGIP
jgi:hypothetical protein